MAAALPIDRSISIDELPTVPRSIAGGDANMAELHGSRPSDDGLNVMVGPDTTPVNHPQDYPARTVGKLFFRMGGRDCVASAVVVERSGIMTAAHCLLLDGQSASEIVFVPAFQNGNARYGVWVIDRYYWPNAWVNNQGPASDVGFCTVKPTADGQTVGDVVGWAGIAWGGAAELWNNMGYPSLAIPGFPFNGLSPWQSLGSRVESGLSSTIAKHDNLTAGGSGEPWFMGDNRVNGLFSQFNVETQRDFSPLFGDWVGMFYQYVFGPLQN
jgi:V8-like Glu-specific endopeptidase